MKKIRDKQDLQGLNIVVFDCEIENEIDGKKITWSDKDKMGLSVAALYDYKTDDYSVYLKNDVQMICNRMQAADLVVGFNIEGFDIDLLEASKGKLIKGDLKNYDILYHSRLATGWKPNMRLPTGLKLDDHLEATFGNDKMKTMHGSDAPKLWQQGRVGEVITYCLADVKRERYLFEHIYETGCVKTATHGVRELDIQPILKVLAGF